MRWFPWKIAFVGILVGVPMPVVAGGSALAVTQHGRMEQIVVHSSALQGNLIGASPDRAATVYLPPGYDGNPATRYPTLYLFHGFGSSPSVWLKFGYLGNVNLPKMMDALIASGAIQPLIVVMPNTEDRYDGAFFTNSPVAGNWDDFVVHDLVSYIDSHYRTLPRAESRAIAGHGGGGSATLVLALRHPETFAVAYAMTPMDAAFVASDTSDDVSGYAFQKLANDLSLGITTFHGREGSTMGMAVAFTPDAKNPPYLADLPYAVTVGNPFVLPPKPPRRLDAVWAQWVANTPLGMVDSYGMNLLLYRGFAFDVGTGDDPELLARVRAFDRGLNRAGIPHTYEEYAGGHSDKVAERLRSIVLPFISARLAGASPR